MSDFLSCYFEYDVNAVIVYPAFSFLFFFSPFMSIKANGPRNGKDSEGPA